MNWTFLKHKKIRLIKDLNSPNNSQYVEFATGEFNGKFWRKDSVYIQDEIFPLIEQAFYETDLEQADDEILQIDFENKISLFENLDRLRRTLGKAKSKSDVETLLTYVSDDVEESFDENFNEAKIETVKLIDDLSVWITSNLKSIKSLQLLEFSQDLVIKIKFLTVIIFAAFAIFACSNDKPETGVLITNNKSYEASIFRQNCAICHGAEAEGKRLEERLVPSLRRGDVETKSEQEIYNQIANGGNGMVPFRNQLTETELRKMAHFVKYDLQKKD